MFNNNYYKTIQGNVKRECFILFIFKMNIFHLVMRILKIIITDQKTSPLYTIMIIYRMKYDNIMKLFNAKIKGYV